LLFLKTILPENHRRGTITAFIAKKLLIQQGQNLATSAFLATRRENYLLLRINGNGGAGHGY